MTPNARQVLCTNIVSDLLKIFMDLWSPSLGRSFGQSSRSQKQPNLRMSLANVAEKRHPRRLLGFCHWNTRDFAQRPECLWSDWADSLQPSLKINDNKRVSRCPPVVLDCHPTRILFSSSSPTFFLLTPSLIAPKMSRSCGPKLFWAWLLMRMRSLWYSKPSGRWCGNCTRTGSETAPRQRKLWSYCKSRSNNVRDLNEKWLPWCHHEHKKRLIDRTLSI